MSEQPLDSSAEDPCDPSIDSDLAQQALAIVRHLQTRVSRCAYLGVGERGSLLLRLEQAADTLEEAVFLDACY